MLWFCFCLPPLEKPGNPENGLYPCKSLSISTQISFLGCIRARLAGMGLNRGAFLGIALFLALGLVLGVIGIVTLPAPLILGLPCLVLVLLWLVVLGGLVLVWLGVLRLLVILWLVLSRLGVLGLLLDGLVILLLLLGPVVRARGVLVQGDPVPPLGELALLFLCLGWLIWRCAGHVHGHGDGLWLVLHGSRL